MDNMVPTGAMRGRYLYGRSASMHQESVKLRLITVQQRPVSLSVKYVVLVHKLFIVVLVHKL